MLKRIIFSLGILLGSMGIATAQNPADLLHGCTGSTSAVSKETQVANCTWLIESEVLGAEAEWSLYAARAGAWGQIGNTTESIADYTHAIELEPTRPEAYFGRAIGYQILTRHEDALADLNEVISLMSIAGSPLLGPAFGARGASHIQLQDFDAALEDYERGLALSPNDPTMSRGRGTVHFLQGNHDEALADFNTALAVNGSDAAALYMRGAIHNTRDNVADAIEDLSEAIRFDPNLVLAWQLRGQIFANQGDYESALLDRNFLVQQSPDDWGALNARCWLRATFDRDINAALDDCNASVAIDRNGMNLDSRGFVYLRQGNHALAIEDYTAAIELLPEQSESFYGRGIARLRSGQYEEGQADLDAANALSENVAEQFAEWGVTP